MQKNLKLKKKLVIILTSKKLKKIFLLDLKKNKIDLVCLSWIHENSLKRFYQKISMVKLLNIHPSLLPKYKGLNTHQRAISNNEEKYSGCTVHYVNSKLDSGKIILTKKS